MTVTPAEIEGKIQRFGNLKKGWHHGEGVPADDAIVCNAIALNREAIVSGFLETNAFPGADGDILFTIHSRNYCFTFLLELDGSVVFGLEKRIFGPEGDVVELYCREGLSLQEAKVEIGKLGQRAKAFEWEYERDHLSEIYPW